MIRYHMYYRYNFTGYNENAADRSQTSVSSLMIIGKYGVVGITPRLKTGIYLTLDDST